MGADFAQDWPMNLFAHLAVNELGPLLELVQRSHCIRRHYELFNWLQEDIQHFLPHDIVIAAWGDFSENAFCYDIVSPLPNVRTEEYNDTAIRPFLSSLFDRWETCDHLPYVLNASNGFASDTIDNPAIAKAMERMRCAVVHGIKDKRGRHNCLYVMLGPSELNAPRSKEIFRFLLPYIDTAFRQIVHLPEQYFAGPAEPTLYETLVDPGIAVFRNANFDNLSPREHEIMAWVRGGKTNQEIGLILNISIFTVKNHLQRIFKKLDVFNRAQAVSKIEQKSRDASK